MLQMLLMDRVSMLASMMTTAASASSTMVETFSQQCPNITPLPIHWLGLLLILVLTARRRNHVDASTTPTPTTTAATTFEGTSSSPLELQKWPQTQTSSSLPLEDVTTSSSSTRSSSNSTLSSSDREKTVEIHVHPILYGSLGPENVVCKVGSFTDLDKLTESSASSTASSTTSDYSGQQHQLKAVAVRGGAAAAAAGTGDDAGSRPREMMPPQQVQQGQEHQQLRMSDVVPPPPPPPKELPLRFLRAGKNDPVEGMKRYEQTLAWRKEHRIDTILREGNDKFELIKKYYPHFFHGRGKNGEVVFIEQPPKTKLKTLFKEGVTMDMLLRHYAMVTEFQWQFLDRNDMGQSIYIMDLQGLGLGDFVGDVVDLAKKATQFTGAHYPERAGTVLLINVPGWFKMIWNIVKPWIDESTLEKIKILRGKDEVRRHLLAKIDIDQIPPEYGGKSPMPLGQSHEEQLLYELVCHNNQVAAAAARGGDAAVLDLYKKSKFCGWQLARSY